MIGISDVLISTGSILTYLYAPTHMRLVRNIVGGYCAVKGLGYIYNKYNRTYKGCFLVTALDAGLMYHSSLVANQLAMELKGHLAMKTIWSLYGYSMCAGAVVSVIGSAAGYWIYRYIMRVSAPLRTCLNMVYNQIRLNIENGTYDEYVRSLALQFSTAVETGHQMVNQTETIEAMAPLRCKGMHNILPQNHPDTCAVCMDEFKADTLHRVLPCKHAFHAPCIDAWLMQNMTCPICRGRLNTQ